MAAAFTYKVRSLKTDPNDDNFIHEATVEIFGTEDSVTKSTYAQCVFDGDKASVGSDFKSIDDLKKKEGEAVIVEWVKAGWTDYKVKKLERKVQLAIDEAKAPTVTLISADDTSYDPAPPVTPTPPTK